MYEITAPILKFLHYKHENTEVAQEQVQQMRSIALKFKTWLKKRWKQILSLSTLKAKQMPN